MTTGGATTMGGGTPILTSTPRSVGIDNVHPQNVNATATSKPFMLLPPVSDFAMYPIGTCYGLFESKSGGVNSYAILTTCHYIFWIWFFIIRYNHLASF